VHCGLAPGSVGGKVARLDWWLRGILHTDALGEGMLALWATSGGPTWVLHDLGQKDGSSKTLPGVG